MARSRRTAVPITGGNPLDCFQKNRRLFIRTSILQDIEDAGLSDRGESVGWNCSCSVGQRGEPLLRSPWMLKLDHTNCGVTRHFIQSSRAEGSLFQETKRNCFILQLSVRGYSRPIELFLNENGEKCDRAINSWPTGLCRAFKRAGLG